MIVKLTLELFARARASDKRKFDKKLCTRA